MLLMHTAALPTMRRFEHRNLARLVQPREYTRLADTPAQGLLWAADNDCFNGGLDPVAYYDMLDACKGVPGCQWVTLPDVVCDPIETIRLMGVWHRGLLRRGLPMAFVAQDGMESLTHRVPWHLVRCLFIGGSTEWKLSDAAAHLVRAAKRRGLLVHAGRVNSRRRYQHFAALGADSFDGTGACRFRDTNLPKYLHWTTQPVQLHALGLTPPA